MKDGAPGLDDATWDRWSNYADHVDVMIRFATDGVPGGVAGSAWSIECDDSAPWSTDWLERQVTELAFVHENGVQAYPGPFTLDSRRTQVSWGASGGGHEVVMWLAEQAASGLLWYALEGLARKMAEKVRESRQVEPQTFDRERASSSALSRVQLARGTGGWESLSVRAISYEDDDSWSIEVYARDEDLVYEVTGKELSPGIIVSRISREEYRQAPRT